MNTNRSYIVAAATFAVLAMSGSVPARADFVSTLNFTNDSALGTGPFGTVDIALAGDVATVTFTAASGYGFVDSNVADLNLTNPAGVAFAAVTPGILTATGSGNVDGEGQMNFTSSIGNASNPLSTISFTLTSASFTNVNTILTANAGGFDAAAHVSLLSAGGATTGFVGENGGGTSVPEPVTLAVIGSGLFGLGLVRRWRRSV
jgi:hypothetical protein